MRIPASLLLLAIAAPCEPQAVRTTPGMCFEEFVQIYEWNDGGFDWRNARGICTGPIEDDPGERAQSEGRVEIWFRSGNVRVVSSSSRWTVASDDDRPCTRAQRLQSTDTKVLRDGTLHHVRTSGGREVERTSRRAHPNQTIAIGGMPRVPPDDAHLSIEGHEQAFGYECQRVRPRANPAITMCTLPMSTSCRARSVVQPIEMRIVDPQGQTIHQGRTTQLRAGTQGSVVQPQDIALP